MAKNDINQIIPNQILYLVINYETKDQNIGLLVNVLTTNDFVIWQSYLYIYC